jgi:pilus assembly protein CpaD
MIMSRTKIIAALALGLGAAACSPTTNDLRAVNNPSLYSLHQPVVERTDFVFDVAAGPSGVSAADQARLDAWFRSIGLRYGDRIAIDAAHGYDYPAARNDVAAVAARYGLLLSHGAPVTGGAVPPGSLRVVTSRAMASVPSCPIWADTGAGSRTTTSSNYGCATNSNVAAMVANPNDLVLGQGGSVSGSATTATRAIRTYREVQPTGRDGLPATSTTDN